MNANIRNLDLTLLLTLDALYEERSVTRAANRLSLSQPAVSGILNRLRDLFGDELYLRTSHGVVPTPRAEAMAGQVKHLIRSAQTLFEEQEFDPATAEFKITICGTDYVNRALFGRLVARLRKAAPKAYISVSNPQSAIWGQKDILGEVDMLFAAHDPMSPDPDGTLLFEDRLVCVSSYQMHDHNQHVALGDLCALAHIIGQSAIRSAVSERLSSAFRERGLVRNILLDVPDFASVFRLMQNSELVAFLPAKLAASAEVDLKTLRVDLEIPAARVFARWHPRLDQDPRHTWLRNMVVDVASTLTA